MEGLKSEAASFLLAFLTGMTVVCAYACIRRLRRVISHSLAMIGVEDALYWLGAAAYVFVQIYGTSGGSIRWYFVAGTLLGILAGLAAGLAAGRLGKILDAKWPKKKNN